MIQKRKTAKQIERHMKGAANHHRINILMLISANDNLTVVDIARKLDANFKTISQHTRYLLNAGLIRKKYRGANVEQSLSPYGEIFVEFIKNFQRVK